ncbi:hypothetical protein [Oligella urethralis]|uniref:Uncharacterized protein n=2 Tax=Oligella TaxID=90243 RepID=A0A096A173_9BURK|nr:hypothetical protein [Oligella urethralis]KGF24522.1 hypothetical protein HMPREF2130_11700 [Oligella urethralis DNF00040]
MSKRSDIIDPSDAPVKASGLVYSEVIGWIDLGHARGDDIRAVLHQMQVGERSNEPYYRVVYTQTMRKTKGLKGLDTSGVCVGQAVIWLIKKGRPLHQRHRIALAMMMKVAPVFEGMQKKWYGWATDSGFSAEDLVSNLLGFYRAVRPKNYFPELKLVSRAKAIERWNHYGSLGKYKNKLLKPLLFPDPAAHKDAKPRYGELPSFMKEIEPFDVSLHTDIIITNHKFSKRDFPNGLGGEFGCVEKRL